MRQPWRFWRFWRFRQSWRFWSWQLPPLNSTPLFRDSDSSWPFFPQISGRNFLPELCGEVHPGSAPLRASALCPLLYRAEHLRGRKGRKCAEKRGGREAASKGGKGKKGRVKTGQAVADQCTHCLYGERHGQRYKRYAQRRWEYGEKKDSHVVYQCIYTCASCHKPTGYDSAKPSLVQVLEHTRLKRQQPLKIGIGITKQGRAPFVARTVPVCPGHRPKNVCLLFFLFSFSDPKTLLSTFLGTLPLAETLCKKHLLKTLLRTF